MIFYGLCALVSLACAIALGLGPVVFALAGVAAAVWGFRVRHPRWWGMPLACAGVLEALGALAGWRGETVILVSVSVFVVLAAVRLAAHRSRPQVGYRRPARSADRF